MGQSTARRRVAITASVAIAAALAGAGCAPSLRPQPPPAPGIPPAPALGRAPAGYDSLRDSLGSVDATVLRGRRIVIDPGHGGFFPGALGVDSLTEKEVNLGVSLVLRDLLAGAGAHVLLTRETDRDFLTPADSSLRSDLAERVRLANAFAPDLFVSVHHNADPGGAHDVNETQTYYQLGDEGPSYDAAQDVFRSMTRNLGIVPTRMLPGNFYVVRNTQPPSLLSEASYITYPPTEAKLRTQAARTLEAEALYMGIARYFMRRTPVIESFEALNGAGDPDSMFSSPPELLARVRGAFDSATLRLDGESAPVKIAGDEVAWSGTPPLAGGDHVATLNVRLSAEGSSRARQVRFHLQKPPARLTAVIVGSPGAFPGEPLSIRVRVLDADGLLVPDNLHVRIATEPRGELVPAETTVTAEDGVAIAYMHRRRRAAAQRPLRTAVVARLTGGAPPVPAAVIPLVRGPQTVRTAFALRMPEGEPLAADSLPRPQWIDRNGFIALASDSRGRTRVPRLEGFRRFDADTLWPPAFVPIANGALQGRRIAIDPEGGGDDPAGIGAGGTRASSLNLDVARALAGMLEASGAAVVLTRDGDHAVSELQRVQTAEAFRAERYIRIGHANAPPTAGHYFNSSAGRRWAQRTSASLGGFGFAPPPVGESSKYPIQQASATAIYVSAARTDSSEDWLTQPGRLRTEAYALYLGLARDLAGAGAAWPIDTLRVIAADGRPLAGAPVQLGAALVVSTDANGSVQFARTEAGPIEVQIDDPRGRLRTVLLESEHGRVLQLPR